jgi:hypothetical protein
MPSLVRPHRSLGGEMEDSNTPTYAAFIPSCPSPTSAHCFLTGGLRIDINQCLNLAIGRVWLRQSSAGPGVKSVESRHECLRGLRCLCYGTPAGEVQQANPCCLHLRVKRQLRRSDQGAVAASLRTFHFCPSRHCSWSSLPEGVSDYRRALHSGSIT